MFEYYTSKISGKFVSSAKINKNYLHCLLMVNFVPWLVEILKMISLEFSALSFFLFYKCILF